MPKNSQTITECALCRGPLLTVLELEPTPPANELLHTPDSNRECYPLNLVRCHNCNHLQLDTEISMFRLFKNDYVYTSNTSAGNYKYLHDYAKEMNDKFHPQFVVDIGSNDGTFLHGFDNCKVLGVDPADHIAATANANGIETHCTFFNQMEATKIKNEYGYADLITCNNTFAHNRNLDEIVLGVKDLLAPTGTFVFEVSYAIKLLENNLFDLIYHEHFHHWTVNAAIKYMKKFDLHVYDAEIITQTHGGSLRVYVSHMQQAKSDRLKDMSAYETHNLDRLINKFSARIPEIKKELTDILSHIKAKGKRVAVLGFPAKACTLSYYFKLDSTVIDAVYDDNPLKIGKYTHQGQLIEPSSFIYKHKPDYLLLLSWNYKDELLKKHSLFRKTGGRFIIPFPKPEVV